MTADESFGFLVASTMSVESEIDLTALVATHAETLFRVAHSLLRNPDEARDVVQDVFVRVLQHRSKLRHISDLRVWLIRIAWNLALDRRKRRRPEQLDMAFAATLVARELPADQALANAQRLVTVLHEIDRLPHREREALLLSSVHELGTADLAQVLGRSEPAVRALLYRARERLGKRLEAKR